MSANELLNQDTRDAHQTSGRWAAKPTTIPATASQAWNGFSGLQAMANAGIHRGLFRVLARGGEFIPSAPSPC